MLSLSHLLCAPIAPSTRSLFFFFNDTATTEIYTLSLHDALPISRMTDLATAPSPAQSSIRLARRRCLRHSTQRPTGSSLRRSEEHTSELQSLAYLVCRLLLEKKKKKKDDLTRDHDRETINLVRVS